MEKMKDYVKDLTEIRSMMERSSKFMLLSGWAGIIAGLIAPFTLIFYGLALFGGGYHTLPEVKVLGLMEILLGIFALFIIKYALIFWATGFGLAHIIYGIYIHLKYER